MPPDVQGEVGTGGGAQDGGGDEAGMLNLRLLARLTEDVERRFERQLLSDSSTEQDDGTDAR